METSAERAARELAEANARAAHARLHSMPPALVPPTRHSRLQVRRPTWVQPEEVTLTAQLNAASHANLNSVAPALVPPTRDQRRNRLEVRSPTWVQPEEVTLNGDVPQVSPLHPGASFVSYPTGGEIFRMLGPMRSVISAMSSIASQHPCGDLGLVDVNIRMRPDRQDAINNVVIQDNANLGPQALGGAAGAQAGPVNMYDGVPIQDQQNGPSNQRGGFYGGFNRRLGDLRSHPYNRGGRSGRGGYYDDGYYDGGYYDGGYYNGGRRSRRHRNRPLRRAGEVLFSDVNLTPFFSGLSPQVPPPYQLALVSTLSGPGTKSGCREHTASWRPCAGPVIHPCPEPGCQQCAEPGTCHRPKPGYCPCAGDSAACSGRCSAAAYGNGSPLCRCS